MTNHKECVRTALAHFVDEHGAPNTVHSAELAFTYSRLHCKQIHRVGRRVRTIILPKGERATYRAGRWRIAEATS